MRETVFELLGLTNLVLFNNKLYYIQLFYSGGWLIDDVKVNLGQSLALLFNH